MLVPNRFSNLKFSLLNITALLIEYLKQEKKASIDDAFSVKYEEAKQEETNRNLASSPVTEGEQEDLEKTERSASEQDVDSSTQLRYWKY